MRVCDDRKTWHSNQFQPLELSDSEKRGETQLITVLTPITNTGRVLSPRIEHRTDNHKSRRDGTFTDSKDETNGEETGKAFASRMATQSNTPDEYVQARRMSIQKMDLHEERVQPTSSIFRQETFAAPDSVGTGRRDIRDRRLFLA